MVKKIFKVSFIVVLALLIVGALSIVIWKDGRRSVEGVLWQEPAHCLPLLPCGSDEPAVLYGVYDKEATALPNEQFTIDHIFLSWTDDNTDILRGAIARAQQNDHTLFVSLEPWPVAGESKVELLQNVAMGAYDTQIVAFCRQVAALRNALWVSWGHEMDHDLTERYPWSNGDPADFIAAYRHFVTACRAEAPMAQFIWSPVGNKNLSQYWAGADVADYVGVPVYSYPAFDKDVYGKSRTFAEAFQEKYDRVKGFDKPVVIVELGVFGEAAYQQQWLDSAEHSFGAFPLLQVVVYFNSMDTPGAWGATYQSPDWRLQAGVSFP